MTAFSRATREKYVARGYVTRNSLHSVPPTDQEHNLTSRNPEGSGSVFEACTGDQTTNTNVPSVWLLSHWLPNKSTSSRLDAFFLKFCVAPLKSILDEVYPGKPALQ